MEIDLNHAVSGHNAESCGNEGDSSLSISSNSSNSSLKSPISNPSASIYMELWHACAGPLTTLPNKGNVVVYFPQGHLEQIASHSSTHFSPIEVPSLGLPPLIFCKIVDVQLLANKENDEVYTKLILLPLPEGNLQESEEEGGGVAPVRSTPQMFCKTLTASDTSTHGGFSVPRRAAEDCFPPLDYKQQRPSQELIAKDLHGVEWKFRHIYRGQPRRHLLTTGWSIFVSQKNLVSGDAVLFLRGEGGELRLGTRRATRPRNVLPDTTMGNLNSYSEILASVANAVSTNTTFHVFYSPRSSRADFVVPYTKYVKSISNMISMGARFKMKFCMDESPERRFSGVVTGVGDMDPYKWPNSKWRCLMVRWDEDIGNDHQERISPWEIDLSGGAFPLLSIQSSPRLKKLRAGLHATPSGHPATARGGYVDFEESVVRSSKVLQGQENVGPVSPLYGRDKMNSLSFGVQPSMHPSFPPNGMMMARSTNFVGEIMRSTHHQPLPATPYSGFLESDNARFPKVLQGQEICSLRSLTGKPNIGSWGPPRTDVGNGRRNVLNMYRSPENPGFYPLGSEGGRNFGFPNTGVCEARPNPGPAMPTNFTRFPIVPPSIGNGIMRDNVGELQVPVEKIVGATIEPNSSSEKDDGASDSIESSCKLFGFPLNEVAPLVDAKSLNKRSCTKVHKQGNKVGRAIDLSKMSSYGELFLELESLFNMEGMFSNPNGGWRLLYTDEENDMMVVGDDPWDEFARMATKIHIYSAEEVEKLMSSGVISDNTSCLEEAPAVVDTAKSSSVGHPD
ncbi:auxin response factor 4-like [Cynara cardunculus var. scolymus]|uniref:auxin response factor 4-like n=1 Tax=Cynara cardunculus var. scolymus TaxID=59895 RepID=UPI000D629A63|nr:auxin response factor 4-like [Cynara cardunculus var. scolymus]